MITYMRRVFSLLLLSCFLCSVLSGVAYGVSWTSIEDMAIDPWADLEDLRDPQQSVLSAEPPEDYGVYMASEDVAVMSLASEDAGIMPLAVYDEGMTYSLALEGFDPNGTDQDGDKWDADGLETVFGYAGVVGDFASVGAGGYAYGAHTAGVRSGFYDADNPISRSATWLGRPTERNGDPNVTVRGGLGSSTGRLLFRLDSFEPTEAVESLTLNDFVFSAWPLYWYFEDWGASVLEDGRAASLGGSFNGAYLYINGVEYCSLDTIVTGEPFVMDGDFRCEIKNTTIGLDAKTYVEEIYIGLEYTLDATDSDNKSCNGGWLIHCRGSRAHVNGSATLVVAADTSSTNTGLLTGIIEWLKSILDGITNIGTAILELPGKIANLIIEGIKTLFVPSEEDFLEIQEKYETMLAERLGFVWEVGEWVVDFGQKMVSAIEGGEEYVFEFPGITIDLPEGTFTVVPATTVDLDNPAMDVVRPVAGTAVSMVCVLAFLRLAYRMLLAVVSGVSYFSFLKGG